MRQLLIISGKGGTGKTTIARTFIELGNIKAFADCDVDAPNLNLIMDLNLNNNEDYYGMNKAMIDHDICISCGLCRAYCKFDAIDINDGFKINHYSCEGCGVCEKICQVGAISMIDNIAGYLSLYSDERVFSTAELKIGEGNSGLLVTKVKSRLKENVSPNELAIIDGSPGIGCPVIASINDVDMALIVVEPSKSGISDLKRIVKTARKFNTKLGICINKFDINNELTCEIERFAETDKIEVLGKIHYDDEIIRGLNEGISPIDLDTRASSDLEELYKKTLREFNKKQEE